MDEVTSAVERTYGSLADPDFAAMARWLQERPHEELTATIGTQFQVAETTDPNNDHAYRYMLGHDGRSWALAISAVRPYAVLARVSDAWDEILTPTAPDLDEYERWLLYRLSAAGLQLLSQAELEQPVGLSLFNVPAGEVRAYHALVEDIPGLPWDKDALRRLGLL